MAIISPEHHELETAVQRYAEVANAVNERGMQRFIDRIVSDSNPEPESEYTEPHYDGYTDVAAINLYIYQIAFQDMDPPREEPRCEAERYNQVLLRPPITSLLDCIPKPLADPPPSDQVLAQLECINAALRQQVEVAGTMQPAQLELPQDFRTLMTLTNGIQAAGIPAETQQTILVYPLELQRVEAKALDAISSWLQREFKLAVAAWEIGGSRQHRKIYYVFCHASSDGNYVSEDNKLSPKWSVVNRVDIEMDVYEDLAHFLRHETESVELTPGGAIVEEMMLGHESYPIW